MSYPHSNQPMLNNVLWSSYSAEPSRSPPVQTPLSDLPSSSYPAQYLESETPCYDQSWLEQSQSQSLLQEPLVTIDPTMLFFLDPSQIPSWVDALPPQPQYQDDSVRYLCPQYTGSEGSTSTSTPALDLSSLPSPSPRSSTCAPSPQTEVGESTLFPPLPFPIKREASSSPSSTSISLQYIDSKPRQKPPRGGWKFECTHEGCKAPIFKKKSAFEKHLRVHTGEKPFQCCHCITFRCSNKSNLTRHVHSCRVKKALDLQATSATRTTTSSSL